LWLTGGPVALRYIRLWDCPYPYP